MPDSKVISIGIVCLAIIVSSFIYSHRATLFAQNINRRPLTTGSLSSSQFSSASSTSSTVGWKQVVGDITVIAPASTSSEALADEQSGMTQPNDSTNLTAQVSKNFFSLYLQDQQNGVAIDNTEATNIADQSLSVVSSANGATQYSPKNIIVINDTSNTALDTYRTKIFAAIKADLPPQTPNVLNLVNTAGGGTNDVAPPSDAVALVPIALGYHKLVADTLKIPVPYEAIGIDLVYVNTLSNLAWDIEAMEKLASDPITAYSGFQNYQKDVMTLQAVFNEANIEFTDR